MNYFYIRFDFNNMLQLSSVCVFHPHPHLAKEERFAALEAAFRGSFIISFHAETVLRGWECCPHFTDEARKAREAW